ncbi:MTH1187 family thiamine-binding protein [Halalkalibacterium halodurans]|uniref:BH1437 protein n=2 Tax=Halalkalibacterium halodurans TaxID=86665 RepID=Q9KCY2_HALH5|nr:MTH1187 family thiamine-binding protein [Halalkalibacterium halodurans]MED4082851.1 MTH1187 family thiamine-binding protein [Halalkalibacterium halodurans]MED4084737.1 MTH1187 family thiamine-binding protein [Halalkalibacterium halodurans]MED4106155.1 MTH1187 family thiamine-binding protein [Halalkalibacterium halodurans]MED4110652.1 MTH1187 family thiamine-binding protein [Halalkalibacterium halodurans]MED4150501.1 MTH1187 family thiamine-binding protein [Halalkalibacterium halodurans]
MKIRGLSFQQGIFYIGKRHVACAYHVNGRLKTWLRPLNQKTLLQMMKHVTQGLPVWFKLLVLTLLSLVLVPKLFVALGMMTWTGLPLYTLLYLAYGTHFIFPTELRKYHGAEHKVFSDRGLIRRARIEEIRQAEITNRYCSTNMVVIYFGSVCFLTMVGLISGLSIEPTLMYASYSSVFAVPIVQRVMEWRGFAWLRNIILHISYWLQRHVTTLEPDTMHMIAAIESYRRLAFREFPDRVRTPRKRKETRNMAIVDVTVIPIGTETPSVSAYVAEIHQVLKTYEDKVRYELTPMSTLIEGELPILFEVIQAIHEVPFQHGIKRVATNIRIDDRRDVQRKMEEKVEAVREKLEPKEESK